MSRDGKDGGSSDIAAIISHTGSHTASHTGSLSVFPLGVAPHFVAGSDAASKWINRRTPWIHIRVVRHAMLVCLAVYFATIVMGI